MLKDFQYKKTMLSVLTLIVAALAFALAFDLLGMPKKAHKRKARHLKRHKQRVLSQMVIF